MDKLKTRIQKLGMYQYQVTIPIWIIRLLKIEKGDSVDWEKTKIIIIKKDNDNK